MNSLEVTSVLKDSQHNFFLRINRIIAVGHMMNGPFFFAGTFKDEKAGGTVLQVGINIVLDSINLIRGRIEIINALAGKF